LGRAPPAGPAGIFGLPSADGARLFFLHVLLSTDITADLVRNSPMDKGSLIGDPGAEVAAPEVDRGQRWIGLELGVCRSRGFRPRGRNWGRRSRPKQRWLLVPFLAELPLRIPILLPHPPPGLLFSGRPIRGDVLTFFPAPAAVPHPPFVGLLAIEAYPVPIPRGRGTKILLPDGR